MRDPSDPAGRIDKIYLGCVDQECCLNKKKGGEGGWKGRLVPRRFEVVGGEKIGESGGREVYASDHLGLVSFFAVE